MERILKHTEGYSNADLISLLKEVAMMPVREIPTEELIKLKDLT